MSGKDKKDLKVADIIISWYVFALVGFIIGKSLGSTLWGLIGFASGAAVGWLLSKHRS